VAGQMLYSSPGPFLVWSGIADPAPHQEGPCERSKTSGVFDGLSRSRSSFYCMYDVCALNGFPILPCYCALCAGLL